MRHPLLSVKVSDKRGKGVFAKKSIAANTVIEIAPVIVLSARDRKALEQTKLARYVFEWGDNHKQAGLALGYVSMYNHSYESNCEYEMDFEAQTITIRSVRKIGKGEELYINYNAIWNDKTPVAYCPQ